MSLSNSGITGLWIDGKPVRRASLGGKVFFEKHNYDLSLVSDKDIISCYDHDTATLTATLTDYNDPIEGETVLMYDSNRISKRKNNILFSLPLDFELILTTSDVITISPVSYDSGTLRIVRAGGSVSVYRLQNDNWIQTTGVSNPTEILIPISNTEVISSSGDIPFFAMGITDNSGECNVVYDSKGAGDLNIKCECMNLQETYELEDLYDYDLTTYNSFATSPLKLPNTPFELSYKSILKTNKGHNTNLNIYGVLDDGTTEVISVIGISNREHAGWHTSFVADGNWECHYASVSSSEYGEYTVKYTYDNGTHSFYVNNKLLISTTKIMNNMHDVVVGLNYGEWIKDLKVKLL